MDCWLNLKRKNSDVDDEKSPSKKAFSVLVYIKNKFQNRIENIESELRLKLSSIERDVQTLMLEMQYHPLH